MNDTDGFDDSMRGLHAHSLQHLSPATGSRLRAARDPDARAATRRAFGWPLGGAFAAMAVIAIALRLQPAPTSSESATPSAPPTTQADAAVAAAPITLEESPDLYVWLASSDVIDSTSERAFP